MKKIARRQSEDAQGGEKNKKTTKSNMKTRKMDDNAGRFHDMVDLARSPSLTARSNVDVR